MHFYKSILALSIFSSSLVLAQQPCYWPDGSGIAPHQETYVNCYSSQDSACCKSTEVCLSNGLCYGSAYGWVRPSYSLSYLEPNADSGQRPIEAHALSKTGVTQPHVRLSGAMMVNTVFGSSWVFLLPTHILSMIPAANFLFPYQWTQVDGLTFGFVHQLNYGGAATDLRQQLVRQASTQASLIIRVALS